LGLVACAVGVAVLAPYGGYSYGYYGAPLAYRSAYVAPVVSSYSYGYGGYPYAYSAYPYGYSSLLLKK